MLHPERQCGEWGRRRWECPGRWRLARRCPRLEAGGWLRKLRPPLTPRSDFLPSLRPREGRNETLFVPNPLVPMPGMH